MSASAVNLLLAYWDGNLPVKGEAIARKLGITVMPEFGFADGSSGCIRRFEGDRYELSFDLTQHPVRQRFTVAHALGHFALGHLVGQTAAFRDAPSDFYSDVSDPKEVAANKVAAQLLMPENMVRFVIEQKLITSLPHLANVFNVSQSAMGCRLKALGIGLRETAPAL